MTVTRTFSATLLADTLLEQGTFHPQTVTFNDGTFWTAAATDDGVILNTDNGALFIYHASAPALAEASDAQGKAANMAYVGSNGHVYIQREGPGGGIYSTELGVGSKPDIAVRGIAIPTITTVVAYQFDYGSNDNDIFLKFLDDHGTVFKTVSVDASTANDQDASVAYLAGIGFVVAWNRIAPNGSTSVWWASYSYTGDLLDAPRMIDGAGSINSKPHVAAFGTAGGFTISYEDNETGDSEVRAFFTDYTGVAHYAQLTTLPGADHAGAVAPLANGLSATVFTHDYLDGGELRERDVYMALADSQGNLLTDPAHPIVIAERDSIKDGVSVAELRDRLGRGTGQVVVSYDDWADGQVHQQVVQLVETVTGDAADDVISGLSQGVIHADGGAGNDTIFDSDHDDRLLGGAGDDLLYDGLGDDYLDGGAGNDTVVLRGASDQTFTVDLGKSGPQDTGNGMDTLVGIENARGHTGVDVLIGTAAANVLDDGGEYEFQFHVPSARDTLIGGSGNDTYVISNATDIIVEDASGGTDLVKSWVSYVLPEFLENLTLLDYPEVGSGNNINGTGNAAANVITGNRGRNILDGKGGADTMRGMGGNDTYYVDNAGDKIVEEADQGIDTVVSSVTYTLPANVEKLTLAGSAALRATGNDLDNTIAGNSADNVLRGEGGRDYITGGQGNDIIYGGDKGDFLFGDLGDDWIAPGGGVDQIDGGLGIDTVWYGDSPGGVTVDLGIGKGARGDAAGDTYVNIENVTGSAYADTIAGDAGANVLRGEGGRDYITGGQGNDTIYGGDKGDFLFGNKGDDLIAPGGGVDQVDGGLGLDRVWYGDSPGGVSVDLTTGTGARNDAAGDTYTGIENVTGSAFSDSIVGNELANAVKGGEGDDIVYGKDGGDTIEGQAGRDQLYGGGGNDQLFGGADNDRLYGNSGVDKLDGGTGNDQLTGGADADYFVFRTEGTTGFGEDIVYDFQNGLDKLDMRHVYLTSDASQTPVGFADLTVSAWTHGVKIVFEAGQAIYLDDTATGVRVADIDAGDFLFA